MAPNSADIVANSLRSGKPRAWHDSLTLGTLAAHQLREGAGPRLSRGPSHVRRCTPISVPDRETVEGRDIDVGAVTRTPPRRARSVRGSISPNASLGCRVDRHTSKSLRGEPDGCSPR
jgi:hypothetical protein